MIRADFFKIHYLATSSDLIDYQLTGSYEIDEVEISRSMRDGNNFSFRIPSTKITAPLPLGAIDEPYFVHIYKDGVKLIEGKIQTVSRNFTEAIIECEDMLYLLTYYTMGDVAMKIFKKTQVIGILDYFLEISRNTDRGRGHVKEWKIGNFFTCDQLVTVLNFDAREEIRISALLERLTNAVEGVYFRFGGLRQQEFSSTGNYVSVDIGVFDNNTGFVYDKSNIDNLEIEKTYELPLYLMYAYGGTYENPANTNQIVDLSDLSTYVGTTDPDYVLSTDFIINQELSADLGGAPQYYAAETLYDDSKPSTQVTPSGAELGEAANGAYRSVIKRFKEENKRTPEIITIDSNYFPENIMPGNKVIVNFSEAQQVYDSMTSSVQLVDVPDFKVQGEFYVESYSMKVGLAEQNISLSLVRHPVYGVKEPQKVNKRFLKKLRKNKEYFESLPVTSTSVFGLYEVTVGAGLAANTTINGNPARTVNFNKIAGANFGDVTTLPTNLSPVLDWYACSDNDSITNIEFTANPTVGVAGFTVAVQVNDTWNINSISNLKVLVKFDV